MDLIDKGKVYCINYSGVYIEFAKNRKIKIVDDKLYFYCTTCKQYKELNDFELRNSINVRSSCKKCRTEESRIYHYYRRRKFDKSLTEKTMKHWDKLRNDKEYHFKAYLLNHTKSGAKKRNIEFNLSIEDINIPEKCPILNKPFILLDKKYTYSIDRVDNSKGYVKDNIRVISNLANTMKNNATNEELIAFAHNILNYIKK